MKLASKKLCFLLTGAALVLAGCTKKPERPDPGKTLIGQTPGGVGIDNGTAPTQVTGVEGLTPREVGTFNEMGQDRSTLNAQTVYFDLNQSNIKASEREKLKVAKEYLDKNPTHKLLLEGHCDWRGTAEYNLALGDRRADSAKKYLISLGVPATRLETLSKGSLDANKDGGEAAWTKDRRVDIVVVDPAKAGMAPGAQKAI